MTQKDDFKQKLETALQRNKEEKKGPVSSFSDKETNKVVGSAFRLGVELASGIIVGCGLGLLIDHYFATSPLGIILCFFLGCAAGMLNVYKSLQGLGYKVGYETRAETLKKEETKNQKD